MAEESDDGNTNWQRRVGLAVFGVAAIVAVYTVTYHWAVTTIPDPERVEDRSIVESAQVVIEALTTAGFGGDTDLWADHVELSLFALVINLTGVLLVFLAIPLFAVPLFRQALNPEPPTESSLTDHIVICGYSTVDDVLKRELAAADRPHLFVEADRERALELVAAGERVVHGDAEQIDTLRRANAGRASTLVANIDDRTNPTVVLSARRLNPDLDIISVVATQEAVPHHRYAGADEVIVSKESLGESLALRSMKTVSERFREAVDVQDGLSFDEYLVTEGSELAGRRLDGVRAFDEHGITVIGGWFGARFLVSPPPDTEIVENSILLVSGEHAVLEELGTRRLPSHQGNPERVVVCGYGDVGRLATETLQNADISTTVIDRRGFDGVDITGDVTTQQTLERAALDEARAVILALDDDVTSVYASLIIKHLEPDVEVIVRANNSENVWKLYNAGADYVLSLPGVTGETLAARVIDEEAILTPHDEFEFVETEAPGLTGQTLAQADIRNRTGCTVVGIERDGDLLTDLGPGVVLEPGDVLVAAGAPAAADRFREFATGS